MPKKVNDQHDYLSAKEREFLQRIPAAARELDLPPARAIETLGHVVRLLAEYEHHKKGIPLEQAVSSALALFMRGLGAHAQLKVDPIDPDAPPIKEMH